MALKWVTLFILTPTDKVVSIGSTPINQTAEYLADNDSSNYKLERNDNGQTDLWAKIDDSIAEEYVEMEASFNNETYHIKTHDLAYGGHGKKRCSDCPTV